MRSSLPRRHGSGLGEAEGRRAEKLEPPVAGCCRGRRGGEGGCHSITCRWRCSGAACSCSCSARASCRTTSWWNSCGSRRTGRLRSAWTKLLLWPGPGRHTNMRVRDRSRPGAFARPHKPGGVQLQFGGSRVGRAGQGRIEFDGARIGWRINSRKAVGQLEAGVATGVFSTRIRWVGGSAAALAAGRPLSADRHGPPGQIAGLLHQSEGAAGSASAADRGRHGGRARCFGWKGCGFRNGSSLPRQTIRRLQWRWKRL